jgi:hypothetical protein
MRNFVGSITSIRASPQAKKALQELAEFYPSGRFKLTGNEITILGKESLGSFCARLPAVQSENAAEGCEKYRLSCSSFVGNGNFEHAEKVVTVNVSDRGCFVFSIREWKTGDRVWLRFLGDEADICGTVCAWQPWGNNKTTLGISIKLDVELNNG